jgi:hypothetical protein
VFSLPTTLLISHSRHVPRRNLSFDTDSKIFKSTQRHIYPDGRGGKNSELDDVLKIIRMVSVFPSFIDTSLLFTCSSLPLVVGVGVVLMLMSSFCFFFFLFLLLFLIIFNIILSIYLLLFRFVTSDEVVISSPPLIHLVTTKKILPTMPDAMPFHKTLLVFLVKVKTLKRLHNSLVLITCL